MGARCQTEFYGLVLSLTLGDPVGKDLNLSAPVLRVLGVSLFSWSGLILEAFPITLSGKQKEVPSSPTLGADTGVLTGTCWSG